MRGLWRLAFFVAGASIVTGGPLHPGGTMAEMLADPRWFPSHALITAGFVALAIGLLLYRRAVHLPPRSDRWARIALWGTIVQVIEMIFHTAASVDHAHLVAGTSTPVLSAHLALAVVAYPLFGVCFVGFIVATARDRSLANPWIAWLGILGAVAHGLAAPLTVLFELEWSRVLFPMVILLAAWLVAAAAWPLRGRARARLTEAA